jgi:alanine dehydrogenase
MNIGVPREIKDKEGRVALSPDNVRKLTSEGLSVLIESGAGLGAGFTDDDYKSAGAILGTVEEAWQRDIVLKVKEPLPSEYARLGGQILFTFLHLSGVPRALTEALLNQGTTAIAYETVEDARGRLPLLAPMSAVAGNMAALVGAYYLAQPHGGKGVQLGSVLGERHGKVLIIGDGVVAYHAARSAHGLGANVVVLGLDAEKGAQWQATFGEGFQFEMSNAGNIQSHLADTDLLVGAVLRRGAKADYVVSESHIKMLATGSVVVDVSIDQGGCIATSRPTSHSDPVYHHHGVLHYCVTNMPGAYPKTSSVALSDAVLPYAQRLALRGLDALKEDAGFAKGLHTHQGKLHAKSVALDLKLEDRYIPL